MAREKKDGRQANILKPEVNVTRRVLLLGVLLLALLLLFIVLLSWRWSKKDSEATQVGETPVIYPNDPEAGNVQEVYLYFRRGNGKYLAPQRHEIVVNANETLETAAVRALIEGPGRQAAGVRSLIPSSAAIVKAEGKGDIFYITFDRELLRLESNERGLDFSPVNERRRLMLYSIVNTVTNIGRYAQVQILVDENNSGYGSKKLLSDFGLQATAENQLLGPVGFDETVLLNASNTAELILQGIRDGEWEYIYTHYLSRQSGEEPLPALLQMEERIKGLPGKLVEWRRESVAEENAPNSYLLRYELRYMLEDGQLRQRYHVPLLLVWEDGQWKMSYEVLGRIVNMIGEI